MKAIDSMWFNTMQGNFGFVIGENEVTGERKLYAGVCNGLNQKRDEITIISWGNKVNISLMEGLIALTRRNVIKKGGDAYKPL